MLDFVKELGIKEVNSGACYGKWIENPSGGELVSYSPIDGEPIATVLQAGEDDYEQVMARAEEAFKTWRMTPAPKRLRNKIRSCAQRHTSGASSSWHAAAPTRH